MTEVYFSPRAQANIRLIAERLAEESELKPSIFRSRRADAVRSLSIFPERGRKRDDLSPGYRSIPVNPVVIVHRIATDAVDPPIEFQLGQYNDRTSNVADVDAPSGEPALRRFSEANAFKAAGGISEACLEARLQSSVSSD